MSELKVNKISPATGTAFTLGDSGDTFTVPSGATFTNSGTATGFGGGKILQVVETRKIDTFTTSLATTVVDITGLSVNITPSATSSSILVLASVVSGATTGDGVMRLYRDSTNLGQATDSGSTPISGISSMGMNRNVNELSYGGLTYLDTAISTTSQVTYKIAVYKAGTTAWYINRPYAVGGSENERASSSITVMEIGA